MFDFLPISEVPIKYLPGNNCRFIYFNTSFCVLVVILFLGFAGFGFCDEFSTLSFPLGFKVSGFDTSNNLVSENGVFSLGFLEKDGSDADGFLVGVRYNIGNKTANVPVWTVGGGLRVSSNSTFKLDMDGKLILTNDLDGLVVWSSNTSNLGIKKASLLNNGNLVLIDSKNKVVWESYSSPTSTLLPGQSLRFPQNLRAPSTKSTTSYYSFVIRESGELALLWEHNVTYWRSHLSSSAAVKEARFNDDGVLGLYADANKMVWSISSKDFRDPSVKLRHLRIDQDGNLRMYSWDNFVQTWRVGWQAVENQCTVFGACGLYSVCGFNSSGPVCGCLFSDSNEWATGAPATDFGNSGCKKMIDLTNCKMRTSMLVMKQTVLYGLYPPHDVNLMLGQEACKAYCFNDTTCIAATSKNDGSGLCTVKRTSIISGYRTPSLPSTSFLKACFVPQAVSARGANPHEDAGSISLSPGKLGAERGSSKMFIGTIVIIILGTLLVIIILQMFAFWFIYKRRQTKAEIRIPFGKDDQMNPHYSALIRLSFEEIQELTSNFSNQLGPSVFKGQLSNRSPVIAKVIKNPVLSEKEFRVAVSSLGRTHHRNLVSLTGFCFETKHKIILFEYIPNGSLDNFLFNLDHDKGNSDWQHRLDIAIGIARGIAYLHSECQQCIVHGNLKLENVLLDEKLVPKVTNFGLNNLKEGATTSESSPEKDIYMLGEMLLQIVLCKKNIAAGQQVLEQLNRQELYEIDGLRGIERVVRIALWCMQSQPFLRPSIGEVVKVLEGTLSVDSPPSTLIVRHESTMGEEAVEKIEIEA